jgi:hypothetical protein
MEFGINIKVYFNSIDEINDNSIDEIYDNIIDEINKNNVLKSVTCISILVTYPEIPVTAPPLCKRSASSALFCEYICIGELYCACR